MDTIYIRLGVSIHAPTRGATADTDPAKLREYGFNPRAHAGRDLTCAVSDVIDVLFQSTRPRGARLHGCKEILHPFSFNPRAHAGRDKADTI